MRAEREIRVAVEQLTNVAILATENGDPDTFLSASRMKGVLAWALNDEGDAFGQLLVDWQNIYERARSRHD